MNLPKTMPQASIVVACRDDAPFAPAARRLMQVLATNRVAATWSVESAEQAQAICTLPSGERMFAPDIAALLGTDLDAAPRLINVLRAIGLQVAAVQVDASLMAQGAERKWNALGVRAVIVGGGAAPTVRSLRFGLWQFAPAGTIPAVRGWLKWSTRPSRALLRKRDAGHAVIAIELAQLAVASPRCWRDVERLLVFAGKSQGDGELLVTTIAQAAARLSAGSRSRPQRSILRTAA